MNVSSPALRLQLPALLGAIALTMVFAAIGAAASVQAGSFYLALDRPAWAPPAWLFGPAWTTLYLLMAVAAWRVWRRTGWRQGAAPLSLYLLQLAFNALWTWLFFVWHQGLLALLEIGLLWCLIVATLHAFGRRERLAAILLLPYLGWVTFAAALSFSIWQRNPAVLG